MSDFLMLLCRSAVRDVFMKITQLALAESRKHSRLCRTEARNTYQISLELIFHIFSNMCDWLLWNSTTSGDKNWDHVVLLWQIISSIYWDSKEKSPIQSYRIMMSLTDYKYKYSSAFFSFPLKEVWQFSHKSSSEEKSRELQKKARKSMVINLFRTMPTMRKWEVESKARKRVERNENNRYENRGGKAEKRKNLQRIYFWSLFSLNWKSIFLLFFPFLSLSLSAAPTDRRCEDGENVSAFQSCE